MSPVAADSASLGASPWPAPPSPVWPSASGAPDAVVAPVVVSSVRLASPLLLPHAVNNRPANSTPVNTVTTTLSFTVPPSASFNSRLKGVRGADESGVREGEACSGPAARLRQREADLCSAFPVADVNFASVSTHHGPDDCETEPAAAVAAGGDGAAEALKGAWQKLDREAGTSIAHPDFDALIPGADLKRDR